MIQLTASAACPSSQKLRKVDKLLGKHVLQIDIPMGTCTFSTKAFARPIRPMARQASSKEQGVRLSDITQPCCSTLLQQSQHPKDHSRHTTVHSKHSTDNIRHPTDECRHSTDNSRHPIAQESLKRGLLGMSSLLHQQTLCPVHQVTGKQHKAGAIV